MTGRLVGREQDLMRVESLLAELGEAGGGLLLVTGDPGIGKTRFAEEVLARTRELGARTAWATAWPDAGAPPLWPWRQVLDQLGLTTTALDDVGRVSVDEADAARFAQFTAVAGALRATSVGGPIAIVLDDLQWADAASLRLLAFAASTLRDCPCLLVGVARQGELAAEDVVAIARHGTHVTLAGLAQDAVRDLLAQSVDPIVADAVHEVVATRSGGNPLFVGEFGRLLGSSGRTEVAWTAVPPGVAAVLQRRLARLSEPVVATLRAAAVLGKEFDMSLVEQLTASSDAIQVRPALDAATREGLLTRVGARDYAFAHDLIREVVLDTLPDDRKADLHRRAAVLVADALQDDPGMGGRLAMHLEGAGQQQEAAGRWEAAARWHLDRLGYEQAAAWFARAARLTGEPRSRIELVLAEADALLRAGELIRARERFVAAADLAQAVGDGDLMVAAVLGIGTGAAAWEVPMADPAYVRLVDEALAQLGPYDRAHRSLLLARLSIAAATPETLERSRSWAEEARALARAIGDPGLEAQALAAVCDAIGGPAHVGERRDHAARIIRLADEAGDRLLGLLGTRFHVVALLELGEFAELDRVVTDFERRAEELGHPLLTWYVPLFRGMRALLKGHLAEADQHLSVVTEAAERTGSTNAALLAATLSAAIDTAQGRVTDPTAFDDVVDVDPAVWASYAAGVGYVALRAGQHDRARALLRLHSENGFARIGDDAEHLATLMCFARIAVTLAESDAAALLYEMLRPYAGMWVVDGIAAVCWGPVELELARLATGLGRAEAAGHMDAARLSVEAAGARLLEQEVASLVGSVLGPAASGMPPASEASADAEWRREGDFWTLSYAGHTVRMKHAKGLADLAVLLGSSGREVHVADLYGTGAGQVPYQGDLGERIDATARDAYRRRLQDLEAEVEEARAAQDLGRVKQLEAERDFLLAELASSLGLGGRTRHAGDPNERLRKAVGTRIKLAIDRLVDPHPLLAAHLRNSVRTGIFCVYRPETRVDWRT